MKPCVVIATHERQEITKRTVDSLLKQSLVPNIVLVCSKVDEHYYFMDNFTPEQVSIITVNNNPLGSKWQKGVEVSSLFNPSCVIIQGSDDILSREFVKNAQDYIEQGYNFVGLQNWWVWGNQTLYRFDYMKGKNFPLGGGRFYSKRFLDSIEWQIFDRNRNNCLDDLGWYKAEKEAGFKKIYGQNSVFNILAVKGNWPVMNKLEVTLNHPNAKLIDCYTRQTALTLLKNIFDYEP